MGWNSANLIFDPVAKALIELKAPDELKTKVLGDLIGALQEGDWDTEDESLDEFEDDPAIVEAFRQHNVIIHCGAESEDGEVCEQERGHDSDPASEHKDYVGRTWPVAAESA